MRISTATLYEMGVARITDLQASLARTQQQLSTGRRILTPADDPIGAAHSLEVTQSQAINAQFSTNRNAATASLSQADGAFSGVSDVIENVKSLVISAGNASLNDQQRGDIATELRGAFDSLLGLANTKDGAGNYLFSGYQTTTEPFVRTPTGARYDGDQGERMIQVGPSRQLAVSESGQGVFQGDGQDMFKNLNDLIVLLETPVTTPTASTALNAGLATANGAMDQALDNVLKARASVGSRLKELDSLESAGQALDEQYQQTLSKLQDLDYARAISTLSQQQLTLEAAQKSFVQITGLSLFSFLS
jgi:flagellar hook-associated protein 3 FlgL